VRACRGLERWFALKRADLRLSALVRAEENDGRLEITINKKLPITTHNQSLAIFWHWKESPCLYLPGKLRQLHDCYQTWNALSPLGMASTADATLATGKSLKR
jgi:hypothetical protein